VLRRVVGLKWNNPTVSEHFSFYRIDKVK